MNHKTYEVRVYENGDKHWYLNGKRHREDGPAIEYSNNHKEWWINGKRHREDGPAIEYVDGTRHWYLNSKLHREDGPAVEYFNGDCEWFLNGREMTEQEFNLKTKSCTGKIVEIDGKKYRLTEI